MGASTPREGCAVSVARAILVLVAALAVVAFLWLAWIAAHIAWYRFYPPVETAFMAQRMDELRESNAKTALQYRFVPYARISLQLKRAMIASEDAKFAQHGGFDWDGISKAYEKNRKSGRVVGGGSTITQQLAKNLFLSPARSYWRKAEEAVVTVLLEAMLPKQRIFELYLNVIEWGSGVFGAEAAARRYFGVSAAQLTAEQAARLAAMTPSPRLFERRPNSPYLESRVATIMARMPAAVVP
jgi:monofunctional biosynthetic peptidoglycan transglycosylase